MSQEILTNPMFYVALLAVSAATAAEIKRFLTDGARPSKKAETEFTGALTGLSKKS